MLSGKSEMKSQNVSCAVARPGDSRGRAPIFTEWMRSGNLIGILDEEARR